MKINILDYNKCGLKCDCGWNLTIGGESNEDLRKIKAFLVANFNLEDKVDYTKKINQDKFIKIDHVD